MNEQPPPQPNDRVPVWELVIADMQERDRIGRERYGTPLQPFNGRDSLEDAYAEALDLAVYLKTAIIERDAIVKAAREYIGALWRVVDRQRLSGEIQQQTQIAMRNWLSVTGDARPRDTD